MTQKGEDGQMSGQYFFNLALFSDFTASRASPSNRAPNSFASDDFQLSSASMSRDSGKIKPFLYLVFFYLP